MGHILSHDPWSKYETLEEQHKFFPKEQSTTWCKYHEDKIKYDRKKCLPEVFHSELLPVFERLSSKELLDSCQKGLNQNQNESLNNVVWSHCPKRVFCGRVRFEISVCEAIVQFNEGSKGRYYLFKTMNITPGDNAVKGLSRFQRICIRKASQKTSNKYKKRRQALCLEREIKKKDNSYVPSAFSTKPVPDVDFTNEPEDIALIVSILFF